MPLTLTRSILGVLVPGIVASAPWLLFLLQRPEVSELYKALEVPFSVLLLVSSVVMGAVCDGAGSIVEYSLDEEREKEFEIEKNWFEYLAKARDPEPVGFRYISKMAATLNFELSMLTAMPIFFLGAWFYWKATTFSAITTCIVLSLAFIMYFRWQARCTHRLLCETRQKLNPLVK